MQGAEEMPDGGPGERIEPTLAMLCRQVGRGAADLARARLLAAGFEDVRPAHVAMLVQLQARARRASEMAAMLRLSKQAVTMMLDQLEDGGYLRRTADPDDLRAKRVQLTDRGRRAAALAVRLAAELEDRLRAMLGSDRLDACKQALTEVRDELRLQLPVA